MTTDRIMLARPMHMSGDDVDFSVDIGGGPVAKSCTIGDYGAPAMVAYEFERLLKTVDAGFNVAVASNPIGHYNVTRAAGNFQITAIDTLLRQVLGYDAANNMFVGGSQSYTADYTPLYTWFPTKIRADQDNWSEVSRITAQEMLTGALSATETGDIQYQLEAEITHLPAELLYRTRCDTDEKKDRCLDTFLFGRGPTVVTGVATSWPADSGYNPLDGFYYFPDVSLITELSSMDAGDVEGFEDGSETYAWCQFDGKWLEKVARRRASMKTGRNHYGTDLPIHTVSDIPTWVTLP